MPLSAVIHLQALAPGQIKQFTGRGVHGFWFAHWRKVDAALGDRLHAETQEAPFTLSPLIGLPHPGGGKVTLKAGQPAFLRVTCLTDALAQDFMDKWLAALPPGSEIEIPATCREGDAEIPGAHWKVTAHALDGQSHPLAAQTTYEELARRHLMNFNPPRQWRLEFLTPTTFHASQHLHLPFPLPESLIGSWLRRWQAFAPIALPEEELLSWARTNLAVSAYNLKTLPAREGERLRIGCVGRMTLHALKMPPDLRAAIDLLGAYALFCGSGSHTAQGLGQTTVTSVQ